MTCTRAELLQWRQLGDLVAQALIQAAPKGEIRVTLAGDLKRACQKIMRVTFPCSGERATRQLYAFVHAAEEFAIAHRAQRERQAEALEQHLARARALFDPDKLNAPASPPPAPEPPPYWVD